MSRIRIIEVEKRIFHRYLPWVIFGIGALFYCYEYLLRIAPSVMSDDIMAAFHLHAGQYGNMVAFYYYAYTPMQLLVGLLMDRYGPRYLLMLACISCFIGAFAFAHSHVFWIAASSRFLVGFGSAFAFVGALKLATLWLPANRFALISGLVTSLGMIGALLGADILSFLLRYTDWRTLTAILSLIGLLIVALVFFFVKDQLETTQHDVYAPEYNINDVLKALAQSLRNRTLWLNGAVGLFLYLSLSALAELWGVPFLMQAHHLERSPATSIKTMIFLGWAIGCPISGWFSDYICNRRRPLIIGSILSAIMISIIIYLPNPSTTFLYVAFLLFGLFSSVQVIIFAIAKEVSPKHISGTAIALTNMFVMLGGVIFQPLFGVILDYFWEGSMNNGVPVYSLHGFQVALSILPAGLILCAVLAFFMRESAPTN
jgi:MFS family permease